MLGMYPVDKVGTSEVILRAIEGLGIDNDHPHIL